MVSIPYTSKACTVLTFRRWIAAGLGIYLLVLCVHPPEGTAQDYLRIDRGPPIAIDPSQIDLGIILDSLEVTVSAVVRNTSSAPVHIRDVVANCTECIGYELDRDRLEPGESTVLNLEFDPKTNVGDIQLFVAVVTGDPSQPQSTMQINAYVQPTYHVRGGPVAFFKVIEGFPQTWRIMIEPQIALDHPLDEVVSGMSGFSGTIGFDDARNRYVVDITAEAGLPPGQHQSELWIQSSTGNTPPCVIPVGATVQETFLVVPDRLILTPSSKEQFRMIVLEQHLSPPARVTGVEVPGSNCRYRISLEDNLSKTWIKVYFHDVGRLGAEGDIVIHTDHPLYPTIKVPVMMNDLASVIIEPDCPGAKSAAQQPRQRTG